MDKKEGKLKLYEILKSPLKDKYYWEEIYPYYDETHLTKSFFFHSNPSASIGWTVLEGWQKRDYANYDNHLDLKDKVKKNDSSATFTEEEISVIVNDFYTTFLNQLLYSKKSLEKQIELELFQKLVQNKNIAFVDDLNHLNNFDYKFTYGDLCFSRYRNYYSHNYNPTIRVSLKDLDFLYYNKLWLSNMNGIRPLDINDTFRKEYSTPSNINSVLMINNYLKNPKEFIYNLLQGQIELMDKAYIIESNTLKSIKEDEIPKWEALLKKNIDEYNKTNGDADVFMNERNRIQTILNSLKKINPYVSILQFDRSIRGCETRLSLFTEHKQKLIQLQLKYS